MTADQPDEQRIDRWLWCARMFKTRSAATKFVSTHRIRVTRGKATIRIMKPSQCVRPGDTVVFSLNRHVRILRVLACAERRGPAGEARLLYEDEGDARRDDHRVDRRDRAIGKSFPPDLRNSHAG